MGHFFNKHKETVGKKSVPPIYKLLIFREKMGPPLGTIRAFHKISLHRPSHLNVTWDTECIGVIEVSPYSIYRHLARSIVINDERLLVFLLVRRGFRKRIIF